MSTRPQYVPGAAFGAEKRKDGDQWTLVMVRDFRHPPARVWEAITEPEHLREWAPFDADRSLGGGGDAKITWSGAAGGYAQESKVKRADKPKLLELGMGGQTLRWELEPTANNGTRITFWINIDPAYMSMGAAGWHIGFDVLERLLDGQPIGRIAGPDAMKVEGWQRLMGEYTKQLKA